MLNKNHLTDFFWDLWCCFSIIGIWPRYIEPSLLCTTHIKIPVKTLPLDLEGLKIVQISDLHLNRRISNRFLVKLQKKIKYLDPDLIIFTGDFLCYSKIEQKQRLKQFLSEFPQAKYGNFAILGNHDYQKYVYINANGDYDCSQEKTNDSAIHKGFKRIFNSIQLTKKFTPEIAKLKLNDELIKIIQDTPFQLLHNETKTLSIKNSKLNICGLGEYMAGKMLPDEAFRNYEKEFPGIILTHNPDSLPSLKKYPGLLALCGHTHGGQINLPLLSKKFLLLENMKFKRGFIKYEDRYVYINRGLGGVMNFRWFSPPEILCAVLEKCYT